MEQSNTSSDGFKVVAIYKFVALPDREALKPQIEEFCAERGIRGTLLLAQEGINGTVAGRPETIKDLVAWLEDGNIFGGRFRDAEVKFSDASEMPFNRMKVRLKSEIVTLRAPEADPTQNVGTYVKPQDWNALIEQDDVIVIDTRNDYEFELGTFDGAKDPATKKFTEFKDYVTENLDPAKNKKVAMFCTGGIRCEKASSYMLAKGFEEVYHLQGGILKYLETIPEEQSKWQGECFVFDERVSVGHGLVEGDAILCRACRQPLKPVDLEHEDYIEGIQCARCVGETSEKTRLAAIERHSQMVLAKQRGVAHIGDDAASAARARSKAKKARRAADRARNDVRKS